MPRKKEAPQRRDEEERRGATWRMGQVRKIFCKTFFS